MFACTAIQTYAIRFLYARERAAQLTVPAAEHFSENSDFVAEDAFCAVNYFLSYIILF